VLDKLKSRYTALKTAPLEYSAGCKLEARAAFRARPADLT
jgi:hypothetical protein